MKDLAYAAFVGALNEFRANNPKPLTKVKMSTSTMNSMVSSLPLGIVTDERIHSVHGLRVVIDENVAGMEFE